MHRRLTLTILTLMGLLAACSGSLETAPPTFMPRPTRTPLPTVEVTLQPEPDEPTPNVIAPAMEAGWVAIRPGWEVRQMSLRQAGVEQPIQLALVRLAVDQIDLRVFYDPNDPKSITEWQEETGATLVVNGGFFTPAYETAGLVVADGMRYGHSFQDGGGMLSVVGESIAIRPLDRQPFSVQEVLDQAVQGQPMLLNPGREPAYFDLSGELGRRTVAAMDDQGRLLFIAVDYGSVSLYTLRNWLYRTEELGLDVAVNLDGGGSTAMVLDAGDYSLDIFPWTPLPVVIGVYVRE